MYKNLAKEYNGKIVTLQKCLLTPSLTNCKLFYLRKLWMLNLTIQDPNVNLFCFLWNDILGGRSATNNTLKNIL